MALYRLVYAPDGTPFEVSPERAADLVLNEGWSNTAPQNNAATTGKKTRKAAEEAPAADTTEVAESVDPVPDEGE